MPIRPRFVSGRRRGKTKRGQSNAQNRIRNICIRINGVVDAREMVEYGEGGIGEYLPVRGRKGVEGLSATVGGILVGGSAILS